MNTKPIVFFAGIPVTIDSAISIVLRSPVFPNQENNGSFVFNFTLPLTDQIKKKINYVHRPGATNKVFSYDITIKYGSMEYSGLATITAIDPGSAEVSLPLYNGCLAQELKDLKLSDINMGEADKLISHIARARVKETIIVDVVDTEYFQTHIEQIPFLHVLEDISGMIDPSGLMFIAPEASHYSFFIEFRLHLIYGGNPSLLIFKNGSLLHNHSPILASGYQTLSLGFSLDLNPGDTMTFCLSIELGPNLHHPHIEEEVWWANLEILPSTHVSVFSSYDFNQVITKLYPEVNYALGPIYNKNFYGNAPHSKYVIDSHDLQFLNEKFPVLNFYDNGQFPVTISRDEHGDAYSVYNTICPVVYLAHAIKKIFEHAKIHIVNNVFESPDLVRLCIYAHRSINRFDVFGQNPINNSFKLADLLPDLDALSFFDQVCRSVGVSYYYNNQTRTIHFEAFESLFESNASADFSAFIIGQPLFRPNPFNGYKITMAKNNDPFVSENYKDLGEVYFKGTVQTIGDLPIEGSLVDDCYLVSDKDAYFYYTHNSEDNTLSWQLYSLKFNFDIEVLLKENQVKNLMEYKIPCAPIMMKDYPTEDPTIGKQTRDWIVAIQKRKWIIPATAIPGKIEGIRKPEPSFYLMFFRGLALDSNYENYPLLSNGYKTFYEQYSDLFPLIDPVSFSLDEHPNSLYSKRFKGLLDYLVMSDGEYTFYKAMKSFELANFDFFKWYNILGMDYLVKELKFEISGKGLSPVEITAIPRNT